LAQPHGARDCHVVGLEEDLGRADHDDAPAVAEFAIESASAAT
jgi:hypothetical protein